MSFQGQREKGIKRGSARQKGRHTAIFTVTLLGIAAVGALIGYRYFNEKKASSRTASPTAVQAQPDAHDESPALSQDFRPLIGRWRRPDGGYVLEIRSIDPTGRMDARYYNPRPINVAHAEASKKDGTKKVFIVLQDKGYPGATYKLNYLPKENVLAGSYFQPTAAQTFSVVFVSMK